jgi:hypothetical protein
MAGWQGTRALLVQVMVFERALSPTMTKAGGGEGIVSPRCHRPPFTQASSWQ